MKTIDQTLALLRSHHPTDPTEGAHRDAMIALCASEGDPTSREHYDPGHFTASAFVLSPDRHSVLLIFHGKLHRWLQPGGHVDPADGSLLEAAQRELAEETGIIDARPFRSGLFDVDVHVIPARKSEPEHRHFDARFVFQAQSLEAAAASDAKDARWVPLDEVSEAESDRSVMRAVEKIQAMNRDNG